MTFPKSGHGHSVAIMEITLSVYKVDQLFDLQKFGKKNVTVYSGLRWWAFYFYYCKKDNNVIHLKVS